MSAKSLFYLLYCFLLAAGASAQVPTVPSRMQLGDMKLIIAESAKKDIQKDIDMLRASDKFFRIKLDRAALYMPIIERILKEEGVPDEIKYLAIQESALISDVVSSSKAVGFWQFKDFTGREVGLRVDRKVDERKNIVSSTYGAARYFKNHQKTLKNWAHTVTAHMTGLGGIKKYTSPKDYGSKKMTITKKSHWYLKRFLAHKIAFENALDYKHSKGTTIAEYKKGGGKDLGRIAREFKVEQDLLEHYNKWLIHGKIPSDKKYTVIIPVEKGNNKTRTLAKQESKSYTPKRSSTDKPSTPKRSSEPKPLTRSLKPRPEPAPVVYPSEIKPGLNGVQAEYLKINGIKAVVVRGDDTQNKLLQRTSLSKKRFLKFNELKKMPPLNPGSVFFVKKKKSYSPISFHVVKPGETMWSISHHYGLRKSKLAKMNRMSIIDELKPGRVLWLKKKRPSSIPVNYQDISSFDGEDMIAGTPNNEKGKPQTAETAPKKQETPAPVVAHKTYDDGKFHVVSEGETLWGISRQYEVSVDELRKWNKLSKYDPIKPGQKLALGKYKLVEEKEEKPKRTITQYTVKQGDTLYQIAKTHDMDVSELIKLNKKKNSDIDIGEELKVYQ